MAMLTLPLFPLGMVVYPGEKVNLHIFEPRYKQLIHDIQLTDKVFGIPPFIDQEVMLMGTSLELASIEKTYSDGRMDIRCYGKQVFRTENFYSKTANTPYALGEIIPLADFTQPDYPLLQEVERYITELFSLLNLSALPKQEDYTHPSYAYAHKIGLSLQQEYQLLTLPTENQRLTFIYQSLQEIIPVVANIERARKRIAMNGHFRNTDSIVF